MNVNLGQDRDTRKRVVIPKQSYRTHWHLIGGTGKGKTTAIHTMLHQLLLDPFATDCWIIIDRMGNLSSELLLWMVSDYCTQDVRDRLVYIEPALENRIITFNPLIYDTPGSGYYKCSRATEIILRGFDNQDIMSMPRLAKWLFNCFWTACQLGLTISDCAYFIQPDHPAHEPLLKCLPEPLRLEWNEIYKSRSGESIRILESTRNRLHPYTNFSVLRHMFGSSTNRLDVLRFMRQGSIVLLNLNAKNRIDSQVASAIGGLVLNEVLATARSLPAWERYPTFLLLDEFQRFVGPDIEEALPEVRQLDLRLLLAHQSFAQLKRGDNDLTSLIFQAQSRMIFGVQGEDADLLAHELASITFDPKRIKDELYCRRQIQKGHRIIELASRGDSITEAQNWTKQYGHNWSAGNSVSRRDGEHIADRAESSQRGTNEGSGQGGGTSRANTHGVREQLVPVIEDFEELVTRSYYSFEEMKNCWARDIRNRRTGECYLRMVDDPTIYDVKVRKSTPGHLAWSAAMLRQELPEVHEDMNRLMEKNFQSDFFVTQDVIERETRERLEAVLRPPIIIDTPTPGVDSSPPTGEGYFPS